MRWTALATVQLLIYLVVAGISHRFTPGSPGAQRPLMLVLVLFLAASALWLWAIFLARRSDGETRSTLLIFVAAVLFRLVLVPSVPIQEVDIYRYLWDGLVISEHVSPYRFTPAQVRSQEDADNATSVASQLARLQRRIARDPAAAEILSRVHYGYLPTIYPPVSQGVFWTAARLSAPGSSLATRRTLLKSLLVLFDLGTMLLVVRLLRLASLPTELVVVYAWCPLVMKEIANSGHLDSVATFFATAAVVGWVRWSRSGVTPAADIPARTRGRLAGLWVALLLALSVGSKMYAVVWLPLFTLTTGRRWGGLAATRFAVVTLVLSSITLWPFLRSSASGPVDPRAGLTAFVERWEMNDFLFLVAVENVRPSEHLPTEKRPWFAVTPNTWRRALVEAVAGNSTERAHSVPFLVARVLTGGVWLVIAGWIAWRARDREDPRSLVHAAMLTLAWFWLLCPTQNPWYWIWVLPLSALARNWAWWLLPVVLFTYYLRFWFQYHFPGVPVWGTRYHGADFFDLVMPWIEFGPWLLLLAGVWLARRRPYREGGRLT